MRGTLDAIIGLLIRSCLMGSEPHKRRRKSMDDGLMALTLSISGNDAQKPLSNPLAAMLLHIFLFVHVDKSHTANIL